MINDVYQLSELIFLVNEFRMFKKKKTKLYTIEYFLSIVFCYLFKLIVHNTHVLSLYKYCSVKQTIILCS